MAKKTTGGAQGAHLASGYISLNVKYGSAMRQIADDFGVVNKKAKETGESITKGLVEKADQAKAKVKELAAEYESQRQKVAALRAEVAKLGNVEQQVAAKRKAHQDAYQADQAALKRFKQESVDLQIELNTLLSAATRDSAALADWNERYTQSTSRRKAELKELAAVEKAYADARKLASPERVAEEAAKRKTLNDEIAKGRGLFEQYGRAVEDATRKQQLAKTTADGLGKSLGNTSMMSRIGHSLAAALAKPFAGAGEKAGKSFSMSLNQSLGKEVSGMGRSGGGIRNAVAGLFMGMTPGVLGAAGAGLALGKAFGMGFQREETINTVKLRLEAMGRSAAEVNQVVAQATSAVEGTQYSLAESLTAASTAMSAGIKLGPEMTQYLNNIANAAGLTGEEFGVVADSINRVQMQGTVSLENIEPLIKKDMPILKWLKEYYQQDFPSATQQDITEMISKKMIPAEVLQKVLTKNLNDSMKGLTRNTVKGSLRDLMTQVGKVTQSILQPFMGDWPTFINSIGDKVKRFAEYIKPGMAVAAAWIKKTWNDLWPKVTAAVGVAVGWISNIWQKIKPGLSTFVDWVKDKWDEIWPQIKKFAGMVVDTWKEMWPKLQEKVGPFMAAFKKLWDSLAPIVGPAVKAVAGLFAWLTREFIKHLPTFMEFGTKVMDILARLFNWMREDAWPWMKKAWANVSEWIGDAIDTVGRWKDNVVNAFNDIKAKITPVWDWLEKKWDWLNNREMPQWAKWLIENGAKLFGIEVDMMGMSTPMAPGLTGSSVPMPAGLVDSGHVASGPQVRHAAGLILSQFPVDTINGSYLPRSEGGPSAPGTHDAGLSMDIPIGTSAEQRSMADSIVKYLQENAKQLGVAYTIWNDIGKNATDNPSGAAGSTWKQGGHQDHIDVHFNGNPVYAATGSNGKTYTVGPSASSKPLGGGQNSIADYIAQKAAEAGYSPSEAQAFVAQALGESGLDPAAYGANTGDATGGASGIFQFTPGTWAQYGNGENPLSAKDNIDAYFRLALDRDSGSGDMRSRLAAISVGGPAVPSNNAPWDRYMAEAGSLLGMVRGAPGQGFPVPWKLGPGSVTPQPPSPTPGTIGGIPIPGLPGGAPATLPEAVSKPVPEPEKGFWGHILDGLDIGGKVLNPNWWLDKVIDPPKRPAVGSRLPDGGMRYGTKGAPADNPDNNFYKDWYPRAGGPDGSKRNPFSVTDDKVGKNTDPANQPKPGEGQEHGGTGAAPGPADSTPHTGSGAAPGPGSSASQPGTGQGYKDLATGLGGVASTAFSDQFAGTPFSDPSQWPATKSAGAVLSFFGNLLQGGGGSAGGGLMDSLFGGGGPGEKGATARQLRDADRAIRRKNADVQAQQAKVDEMISKSFKYDPKDITAEQDRLAEMKEDLGYLQEDQAALQGKGQQGASPFSNLLSYWGIQQPAAPAGNTTGYTAQPYGNLTVGSPGAAPGSQGPDVMSPGAASIAPALLNAVPQAANPANYAPGQPNQTGGGTSIDMSINQQVSTPGITAAQDAAKRAQNTQYNSHLMNITKGVLV